MSKLPALLPPWAPLAAVGALLLALGGAIWGWLDAREELGAARLSAAVNAASAKAMSEQADLNQALALRLEQLTAARGQTVKETIREVYIQPSSNACRNSAPMRALNGRLRYGGDGQGGGSAAAGSAPAALPTARR
jgi:hypothetical protein